VIKANWCDLASQANLLDAETAPEFTETFFELTNAPEISAAFVGEGNTTRDLV
jgi:hypothetical protein